MALEFKLPDIGEGIAEGEIVKWHVAVGDVVAEHQTIVEVMTDKATVEIPAPMAGTIASIDAAEGDVVPVGNVIYVLNEAGAPAQAAAPVAAPTPAAAPAPAASNSSSTLEFKLPDVGEGIAEGEIVKWHVAEGDDVIEHQTVVEVMTDKATVEIPSPAPGKITKLLAGEGDVVPVGDVIFHLAGAGAPAAAPAATAAVAATPAAAPVARAVPAASNEKVLAVPSARRVARELNIDLGQVAGSGRNGVVRRADVEAFAKSGGAATAAPTSAPKVAAPPVSIPIGDRETRVPFRGVRRKISEAMTRSAFTATHFTVVEELDVTELIDLRTKAKAVGAKQDIKVTYMPFIMKAVASALHQFPMLNGQLDESTQEIVTFHYVNLGIATDTPMGLIVPVIPDVQSKGILQLASELGDLAGRTREGKMKPEELKGGTFTITNAGNIGGILATPIINFPEVGILGVHRMVKRPGVVETPEGDEIAIRSYMNLSISVDHRLVDGADAVRFLVHIKTLLEDPGLLSL
ncbi:MAG: pyruvate dehydrogenase E2 component (dihydrolipoamide acetyltransferase) [Planctomycetota bacterium]|jgi:pyruvate dehydrogenase E2 component (dihydrolipoamide acetyltransferase)